MVDVMIDLETLGLIPGSAIVSIGAVSFELPTISMATNKSETSFIKDEFYYVVRPSKQYTIDYDTVCWWLQQSPEATAIFQQKSMPIHEALKMFSYWFTKVGGKNIWGHGASFDIPMLEAAYCIEGLPIPWNYRNIRDTRTIFSETGECVESVDAGIRHHALADAKAQALAVIRARQKICLWRDFPTQC